MLSAGQEPVNLEMRSICADAGYAAGKKNSQLAQSVRTQKAAGANGQA